MNDTTNTGLGGAFSSKTKGSQIAYGHPYGKEIIDGVKKVLKQCDTGKILLKVAEVHKVPIHVIKGQGASGFNADARIVYIQASARAETATPELVINMIIGLRGADQEFMGFTAPDPRKDLMEYATVIHAKNLDNLVYVCKVVKELTNTSHYKDLLDGLNRLGYGKFYQAYLSNVSREELYDVYAET
jgi:hypothetical protein